MNKHIIMAATALGLSLALAACSIQTAAGSSPDDPVSSDDPIGPAPEPTPIEGDVIEGLAFVEGMDILILESFPVQIMAALDLQVGDTCTTIGEITVEREDRTFTISIPTIRPANEECAEEVTRYQENVALDVLGLEAGEYTVAANGVEKSFTLDMDNVPLDMDSDQGGSMETGQAGIQAVSVSVEDGQATVTISGWLADACTDLGTIYETVSDQKVTLTVETLRPADLMCTQAITEFDATYALKTPLDAGDYTLTVNDMVSVSFTIE